MNITIFVLAFTLNHENFIVSTRFTRLSNVYMCQIKISTVV